METHKVFHRKCVKICDKYQTIQSFPPSVEKEMVENTMWKTEIVEKWKTLRRQAACCGNTVDKKT